VNRPPRTEWVTERLRLMKKFEHGISEVFLRLTLPLLIRRHVKKWKVKSKGK